jgi:hypothetical protein
MKAINKQIWIWTLMAAPPILFGALAYGADCIKTQLPNPRNVDCNDSFAVCGGVDKTTCLSDQPYRVGEVLQQGIFGTTSGANTDQCMQDGAASLCKIQYRCKWDDPSGSCVVDLATETNRYQKATFQNGCR